MKTKETCWNMFSREPTCKSQMSCGALEPTLHFMSDFAFHEECAKFTSHLITNLKNTNRLYFDEREDTNLVNVDIY